jgi:dTDP-glucose 4,6-dehydratase
VQRDVCDRRLILRLFVDVKLDVMMCLAAESCGDRLSDGPVDFIQTNIFSASMILERVRDYRRPLPCSKDDMDHHQTSSPALA